MEGEVNKSDLLNHIYMLFTEENRKNLVKTAQNLLKVQREDAVMLIDISPSSREGERL